jgi:DNA helicase-2/ATP-dependent DNA helicase PcrA
VKLALSDEAHAALAEEGPMLVLGGPGSGKTTLSLLKAQRLIPDLEPGQEILFLSFSRAAVRQVLTRCKDILTPADRRLISVKTYHSFCMDLLRAHGRLLSGRQARLFFPGAEKVARSEFDGDWLEERKRLASEEGLYAFDLFADSSADLLERSVAVRNLISDKYPVVILDEFQDTDNAQWLLVRLLSERSRVIVLADPDQRIFEYDDRVDPERLNQLRAFMAPAEYDFGGENHRSPDAGVLQFADAVLRVRELPTTDDVRTLNYWPRAFESSVHAAVVWLFSNLRAAGVKGPTVAVLCRANGFVADISNILGGAHTFNDTELKPVDHEVVWDEELSASAAQVVASILEWSSKEPAVAVEHTLSSVADYYQLKNAGKPSQTAKAEATKFRNAAARTADGKPPTIKAAKQLVEANGRGVELSGSPAPDWLRARDVLLGLPALREILTNVRFVRLFRATDEIGAQLGDLWRQHGAYRGAADVVRRTLEMGRLVADQRDPRGCLLMTMHKSKGKEFDGVVLVEGAYKGKFFDDRREEPPYLASRRLLRVGITRARHKVVIVRPVGALALGGS